MTIADNTHERNSSTAHVVALALAVAALSTTAACLQSKTSPCANIRCPLSTTCFAIDGEQPRCLRENICGNDILEISNGEACDDGNTVDGDGCSEICQDEVCGNGVIDPGEVCDDGNNADGDGCNRSCQSSESCGNGIVDSAAGEICDDGNDADDDGCSNGCRNTCGDGIHVTGEECDDGAESATCDFDCTVPVCGDGHLNAYAGEHCDTGELVGTSICSRECQSDRRIAIGRYHTCVLRSTGAVRCWGYNLQGQLGHGHRDTIGDNEPPASAGDVDVGVTVVELAAGLYHTCARTDTGSVRCWGSGASGRLGYGNTDNIGDDESPASAGDVDIGSPVVQLVAGLEHTCVLTHAGKVRCWGRSHYGQLGYGNTDSIGDNETPASAGDVDVGGIPIQLAAGDYHTCALLAGGTVRCWGNGSSGRLGYGNSDNVGDDETPASAGDVDVGGSVVQLTAGGRHTCALLSTGAPRCWGDGLSGQLGYGNTDSIGNDETPASAGDVEIGSGSVVQLTAGSSHTCALLTSPGAVRCWGSGIMLGYGSSVTIGDDEAPADAGDVDVGGTVVQLAAAESRTCALLDNDAVRCWGINNHGSLGYGFSTTIGDDETPASAGDVDAGGRVEQIAAGYFHTCALLETDAVRCWGYGHSGRLGYGDIQNVETPANAGDVPLGATVAQLALSFGHACARLSTGAVRCWGSGTNGRLGYGNTDNIGDDEPPDSVADVAVGGPVAQVVVGEGHSCALLDSNKAVRCWGSNGNGQLGYRHTRDIGDDEAPDSAGDVDVGGDVTQIAAGALHTCALLESNKAVRCWGRNDDGQLGYGHTDNIGDDEYPDSAGDIDVGGPVAQIAAGYYHTCALLESGTVRCWGRASYGPLGYGNSDNIGDDEPPASAGDVNVGGLVVQISAGLAHTCALLDTHHVRCWGQGAYGQLGYGNTDHVGSGAPPASAGDVDVGGPVTQIAVGDYHTCAVLTDGAVRCWGWGTYGQLGYGYNDIIGDNETPADAGDVPLDSP